MAPETYVWSWLRWLKCRSRGDKSAASPRKVRRLTRKAAGGDSVAAYELSILYAEGNGVEKNWQVSEKWMLQAAEGGHGLAQRTLGDMYFCCVGGYHTISECKEWHDSASAQGVEESEFKVDMTPEEFENHVRIRAEEGLVGYQLMYAQWLAYMKEDADGNKQPDFGRALEWFEIAEKNGAADARKEKHELIRIWLESLAASGDTQYHLALARHYFSIVGEEPDAPKKALEWLSKAAELGNLTACQDLSLLYESGEIVTQDYERARYWANKASQLEWR